MEPKAVDHQMKGFKPWSFYLSVYEHGRKQEQIQRTLKKHLKNVENTLKDNKYLFYSFCNVFLYHSLFDWSIRIQPEDLISLFLLLFVL